MGAPVTRRVCRICKRFWIVLRKNEGDVCPICALKAKRGTSA
jgi:hypothetical protein